MSSRLLTLMRKRGGFNPSSISGYLYDWFSEDVVSISSGWADRNNGLLFDSSTNLPTLVTNAIGSKPVIRFNGSANHWRSESFALSQPFTIYTVAKHSVGGGRFYDGNTVNQAIMSGASTGASITPYSLYAGLSAPTSVKGSLVPDVFVSVFNGASSSLKCGKRTAVTGNAGTAGYTAGMVLGAAGNLAGGFFAAWDLGHLLIYNEAHSVMQQQSVVDGLATLWPIQDSIRFAGDSNTSGTGTTSGNSYPEQTVNLLPGSWELFNGGSSGTTIAAAKNGHTLSYGRYVSALRKNVHVIMYGTNDIYAGAAAATVYADLKVWWADAMASGATLIVVDLFDRTNWTAGQRSEAASLNSLIASDDSLYHGLVDVSNDSRFDMSDTLVSADGVHLTDLSAGWLADLVAEKIISAL